MQLAWVAGRPCETLAPSTNGMGSREVNPSAFRDGRLQLVLMPGPLVGTLNLNRQPG